MRQEAQRRRQLELASPVPSLRSSGQVLIKSWLLTPYASSLSLHSRVDQVIPKLIGQVLCLEKSSPHFCSVDTKREDRSREETRGRKVLCDATRTRRIHIHAARTRMRLDHVNVTLTEA